MILDTNALSAIADGEAGPVAALRDAAVAAIPVVVLGEYRFGIAHSKRREDYENWLDANLPACRVLDITDLTAIVYAGVRLELKRAGTPIPANDAWIAALCLQHHLPLLSQDRHFDLVNGVRRVGW
jgi:predicted nucleic acid-binding protein